MKKSDEAGLLIVCILFIGLFSVIGIGIYVTQSGWPLFGLLILSGFKYSSGDNKEG